MAHMWNASICESRQKDHFIFEASLTVSDFSVSLGYSVKPFLKQTKQNNRRKDLAEDKETNVYIWVSCLFCFLFVSGLGLMPAAQILWLLTVSFYIFLFFFLQR